MMPTSSICRPKSADNRDQSTGLPTGSSRFNPVTKVILQHRNNSSEPIGNGHPHQLNEGPQAVGPRSNSEPLNGPRDFNAHSRSVPPRTVECHRRCLRQNALRTYSLVALSPW
jgi:hypothetical protein